MRRARRLLLVALAACASTCRAGRDESRLEHAAPSTSQGTAPAERASAPPSRASAENGAPETTGSAPATASTAPPEAPRDIGPYELPFADKRNVFFVVPPTRGKPQRLLAMLHGLCNPPGYACGHWAQAASERGFLVCPSGDSSCGPAANNAPTWNEPFDKMGDDLERAIAVVDAAYPGELSRDGAILAGFSRGAYATPDIVARHPGRWRFLLLAEADVSLSAERLRAGGIRAVALLAGELGTEHRGEARTAAALEAQGLPARLWLMPRAGHWYSENIDAIMREAVGWLIAHEAERER